MGETQAGARGLTGRHVANELAPTSAKVLKILMGLLTQSLVDGAFSGLQRLRRVDPMASAEWFQKFAASTRDVRRYRELKEELDDVCIGLGLPPGRYARIRCSMPRRSSYTIEVSGAGFLAVNNRTKGRNLCELPYFEVPSVCRHLDVKVSTILDGKERFLKQKFEVVPEGYRPDHFDIIPKSGPIPELHELQLLAERDRAIAAALESCNPTGPATPAEIAAAEDRLGRPIPYDLRQVLAKVGSLVDHCEYGWIRRINEVDTAYNQLFSIWWFRTEDIEHTDAIESLKGMTGLFFTSPDEQSCEPFVCTLEAPYKTYILHVDSYGKSSLQPLMTDDGRRASVRDALIMASRKIGYGPSLPQDVIPLPGNLELIVSWNNNPKIYFSDRPWPDHWWTDRP